MRTWLTEIRTFDGTLWGGDNIDAISKDHAIYLLENSGRGYMTVIGYLVATVDEFTGEKINFDEFRNN